MNIKNEKGITLIALVIMVIVLTILAGITFISTKGAKENTNLAKSSMLESELAQVHQVVLETDIKYKQTKNQSSLVGEKITYSEAESLLKTLSDKLNLQGTNYDENSDTDVEQYYYKLDGESLKQLGISDSDQKYVINYSTGEVFNYSKKVTQDGNILYYNVD